MPRHPVADRSISARVATTSASSTPRTTSTPPGPSSTKVRSWLGLLVPGHERDQRSGSARSGRSAREVEGADHPPVELHPLVVDAAQPPGQQGGEHQADGHRLAVAEVEPGRRVEGDGLEGVGQGVAVVEEHPAVALPLVGRHHLGLDGRRTGPPARRGAGRAARRRAAAGRRTPRKAYLAISPRPDAHSRGGRVASTSVSQSTALGCQNAPTRFFPSGRLTPVLPPMAASTWASSVVATFT